MLYGKRSIRIILCPDNLARQLRPLTDLLKGVFLYALPKVIYKAH